MKLRARVRIRNTPVERRHTKRREEKEGNLFRKKKEQEAKQGGARKATNQEKGAQTAVRTPFKKDSSVMVLRIILSDLASEGKGATGTSHTVLRGFRSPRQIRFRHRRGSRHREILDHRNARHRDDSDHRGQRDV